jgi:hypothetical protein
MPGEKTQLTSFVCDSGIPPPKQNRLGWATCQALGHPAASARLKSCPDTRLTSHESLKSDGQRSKRKTGRSSRPAGG